MKVVLMSGPDAETLRRLGRQLVEERLAACVTVLPEAVSVYRWEGELREEDEAMAIAKTAHPDRLVQRAAELHPYDTPEVLVLPVESGLDRYICLLYTSPSPRDRTRSRMPSSA